MQFGTIDYIVFIGYLLLIVGLGLWVSREKKGHIKDSKDYFLASKSLPWWAIGASLIAANISAEQFIGMSGSGFAIGLAIASYEWMAAITLIIVGKFFLPIFIEKKLYTIPEFIEKRFSTNLKTILAIFWVALFIFVNLSSVRFLGGNALDTIIGNGVGSYIIYAIIFL
ncbi:MAG: sodium/glucose cotransporter, partial [Calditrichaceae bacterium]